MYIIIGKKVCIQTQVLQKVLKEKKITYHYMDEDELNQQTMLFLKAYYPSYPIVLGVRPFQDFTRILNYFRSL